MSSRIILISCGKKKLDHKTEAENLYISPLFKYNLRYAKSLKSDKIFILSTEYGLVGLKQKIEPYDLTLNRMPSANIQKWANQVVKKLSKVADLKKDEFTFLAGQRYRQYLIPKINNYKVPLEGLGIGKQLGYLKNKVANEEKCGQLHKYFNNLKRLKFPFLDQDIPKNGIYVLFEKKELAHEGNRIVRVGTHTGLNQLRSRLKQHFIQENKDRSIFRKNIGRCFLNKQKDSFLEKWELDLTAKKDKEKNSQLIDFKKQKKIEQKVSKYIQNNFSFVVFLIENKKERLALESKIISTISLCNECQPSKNWFGFNSPKEKIKKSGLWLVNELYKEPLSDKELKDLRNKYEN